jgi:predicted ATPase
MYQYKLMQKMGGIIIYDRGVPDNIAYAQLFNLDYRPAHLAAKLYRYHPDVFVFPEWEEIVSFRQGCVI